MSFPWISSALTLTVGGGGALAALDFSEQQNQIIAQQAAEIAQLKSHLKEQTLEALKQASAIAERNKNIIEQNQIIAQQAAEIVARNKNIEERKEIEARQQKSIDEIHQELTPLFDRYEKLWKKAEKQYENLLKISDGNWREVLTQTLNTLNEQKQQLAAAQKEAEDNLVKFLEAKLSLTEASDALEFDLSNYAARTGVLET